MLLSCLLIDVGDNPDRPRPGRLWLRNRYRVHQRLCMAFPYPDTKARDPAFLKPYKPCGFRDQRPVYRAVPAAQQQHPCATVEPPAVHVPRDTEHNFLFRVDPQPEGRVVILVQSAVEPDWDYAFHNAGHLLAAPPETKAVEPQFETGEHLRFRLLANPTKKIETLSKEQRLAKVPKRHGKRVPVDAVDLSNWLSRRGDRSGFCIEDDPTIQLGYIYVNSGREVGSGHRLRSVRYDGLLQVTEPENFRAVLATGIGPAKAFGFGLLSVAPVR